MESLIVNVGGGALVDVEAVALGLAGLAEVL